VSGRLKAISGRSELRGRFPDTACSASAQRLAHRLQAPFAVVLQEEAATENDGLIGPGEHSAEGGPHPGAVATAAVHNQRRTRLGWISPDESRLAFRSWQTMISGW
jgi:hypothetical protein